MHCLSCNLPVSPGSPAHIWNQPSTSYSYYTHQRKARDGLDLESKFWTTNMLKELKWSNFRKISPTSGISFLVDWTDMTKRWSVMKILELKRANSEVTIQSWLSEVNEKGSNAKPNCITKISAFYHFSISCITWGCTDFQTLLRGWGGGKVSVMCWIGNCQN